MTTASGTILEADGDSVTIVFDQGAGACGACLTGSGCGLGPILSLFTRAGSRSLRFRNSGRESLRAGDRVCITVRGGRLAALAVLAYGMPLVGVFAGAAALAAAAPGGGDLATVGGALAGAAAAWLLLRFGGAGRLAADMMGAGITPAP